MICLVDTPTDGKGNLIICMGLQRDGGDVLDLKLSAPLATITSYHEEIREGRISRNNCPQATDPTARNIIL